MKIQVLHIMNSISPTNFSYELACRLDKDRFDTKIIAFLGVNMIDNDRIINLEAGSKFDLIALKKIDNFMKANSIDILHTHDNISGSIARVLGRKNKVPVIVDTEHGSHSSYKLPGNIFNDLTLFLSDKIVNVSKWVANSYAPWEKILVPREKMCILHNGVDLEHISKVLMEDGGSIEKKYSIKTGDRIFLSAARLTGVKNQYKLIEGFVTAAAEFPDIKLIIAGEGELKPKLMQLIKQLNMEDRVILTGLIPREDVYRLMKKAYGFVMNSHSEGLCTALLQAMACGLPCILSNIPSFRETVMGEDVGEFIMEDTVKEVECAFRRFLDADDTALSEKGENARKLAWKYYNIYEVVKNYENLYVELLNRKRGLRPV